MSWYYERAAEREWEREREREVGKKGGRVSASVDVASRRDSWRGEPKTVTTVSCSAGDSIDEWEGGGGGRRSSVGEVRGAGEFELLITLIAELRNGTRNSFFGSYLSRVSRLHQFLLLICISAAVIPRSSRLVFCDTGGCGGSGRRPRFNG